MHPQAPTLEMRGVVKHYHGLRPLRIASLSLDAGDRLSIGGIDAGAGEVLVSLVTGAALPDEGEVRVFGRTTAGITEGDQWLEWLDGFGIVSDRAVLLSGATLLQNLALPFTLAIEPVPPPIVDRVRHLARRCGIEPDRWLAVPAGALPAEVRVRSHFARAVALEPRLLILEDPAAALAADAVESLAADLHRAWTGSGAAMLTLTSDERFATLMAPRNLTLHGATGELKALRRRWRPW